MLRFGPEDGPVVVVAPALFEEANRTRALIVRVLRLLAERGIGSVLPDLPAQGESLVPTADARLAHWRAAFAACVEAAGSKPLVFALRGGVLVASEARAKGRYHCEPERGAELVRILMRARRTALLYSGQPIIADDPEADGPPMLLAGNVIARELARELMTAEPGPADRTVEVWPAPNSPFPLLRGRRVWLASEPMVDPELLHSLTEDLAGWVARCAA